MAEKVATFRHAKIAAVKLAGDPNDKIMGEQTIDQLREGIMADLEKLADAGVIDLKRCWLAPQINDQIDFEWWISCPLRAKCSKLANCSLRFTAGSLRGSTRAI